MEDQPSLYREIGQVAWLFAKVLVAVAAVLALFAWLIVRHPAAGMIALYGFMFAALILYIGWQNYKWKVSELEWKRKWEAEVTNWNRAS